MVNKVIIVTFSRLLVSPELVSKYSNTRLAFNWVVGVLQTMSLEAVSVFERLTPLLLSMFVSLCVVVLLHCLDQSEILLSNQSLDYDCPTGMFRLPGMPSCESWLDCGRISAEVKIYRELQFGPIRQSHLAKWGRHLVMYSVPADSYSVPPGSRGESISELQFLQELSGSKFVAQLIGYCLATGVILTEYHRLVTAAHVNEVLTRAGRYSPVDRLSLCVNFAEMLTLLHSHSPPLVLCPASPHTLLSQMILTADHGDHRLLLWDTTALVALDKVSNGSTVCSGWEEEFVAPEQIQDKSDASGYTDTLDKIYNEAVDIWRAPTICSMFLGQVEGSKSVKNLLQPVHRKCRDRDPTVRPTARDLLRSYKEVLRDIWQHNTIRLTQ